MVTAAFTKLGISVARVIDSKVTTRCVQCTLDLWHSSLPVLWSDISQTESKCSIESPSTFKLQLHIWWSSDVVFSTRFFSSKTRQTFSFICILSDKYAAFVVIEFNLSKGLFFAVTILLKYFQFLCKLSMAEHLARLWIDSGVWFTIPFSSCIS